MMDKQTYFQEEVERALMNYDGFELINQTKESATLHVYEGHNVTMELNDRIADAFITEFSHKAVCIDEWELSEKPEGVNTHTLHIEYEERILTLIVDVVQRNHQYGFQIEALYRHKEEERMYDKTATSASDNVRHCFAIWAPWFIQQLGTCPSYRLFFVTSAINVNYPSWMEKQ